MRGTAEAVLPIGAGRGRYQAVYTMAERSISN